MLIRPARSLRGEITLPGDKSISHRAAMIASIAQGESHIENFATSADCQSTLNCLRQLGVKIRQQERTVWIEGNGLHGLKAPSEPLDCGNSGTTMRLLAGMLAGQRFDSELFGDESLQRRPMTRIAEPLNAMGGSVVTTAGKPPVRISGRPLNAVEYRLPVASAQIKSCILLAGLYANGTTVVTEPNHTRDHTERMLRKFGIAVQTDLDVATDGVSFVHEIVGGSELRSRHMTIPGDISASAFFMIGAACLEGSDISMRNVGFGEGRMGALAVLALRGGRVEYPLRTKPSTQAEQPEDEPIGDIHVLGGLDGAGDEAASPVEIGSVLLPSLIDEIPILAVLGTRLPGGIKIRDAAELRVKETDRIAAVVENLRRMDADVEEFDDGFRVGKSNLKGARVDSFGDHRIAMAFAIAGLLSVDGDTEITGAEAVDVSFPGFFETLKNVVIYE